MAAPSLEALLAAPTQKELLDQEVIPELRLRGVRVTDWLPSSIYRGMAYVVSRLGLGARTAIRNFTAASFEDIVFGFVAAPDGVDLTSWAPVVARQRFGIDRIEASHTKRTIRFTNTSTTNYGPYSIGSVIIAFPSGNRYVSDEGVLIPAKSGGVDGVADVVFRSEFPTDSEAGLVYSTDPSNASITMVTSSFAGVTATNPAPAYSEVSQVGSGTGTVTPSGTPSGSHSVAVRVNASGQAGAATVSTSIDGAAYVSQGTTNPINNLGGFGINITLANGAGTPSFITDTVYYFSTPGSDITQVGRDVESPQELGTRCYATRAALAFAKDAAGNIIPLSPTASGYEALARAASDQIKSVLVKTSDTINNEVLIYIAGQGSVLPASVLAVVAAFFASRPMITDRPSVLSPATRAVTLGGMTVTVKQAMYAAAVAELQRRLQLYFGGVDNSVVLGPNGRIDHAYINTLIRTTPGVTKTTDTTLTINAGAGAAVADAQLPTTPGAVEMASWTQNVASAFTWVLV